MLFVDVTCAGVTLLYCAIGNFHLEIAFHLIASGHYPSDNDIVDFLFMACSFGELEMLKKLIERYDFDPDGE